jgi:hypothetical protein
MISEVRSLLRNCGKIVLKAPFYILSFGTVWNAVLQIYYGFGNAQSLYRRTAGWVTKVRYLAGAKHFNTSQRPVRGPISALQNAYRRLFTAVELPVW